MRRAFVVEKRSKTGTVRACLKEGCDWEIGRTGNEPAPAAGACRAEVPRRWKWWKA
jgi:hypothetical protein